MPSSGQTRTAREILKGNYNGTASVSYTILEGIQRELAGCARVYYSEGCDLVRDQVEALAEPDDRISEAVAAARRSDVVFLCLGLNATLEGEEGDAANSYAGADRKDLGLPDPQCRLLKAVCETGTPVFCWWLPEEPSPCPTRRSIARQSFMCGIRARWEALPWRISFLEIRFLPESSRLPFTVISRICPPFEDYSMKGRTYRYLTAEPLYPFGYGLSYAEFEYANARVTVDEEQENIHVRVAGGQIPRPFRRKKSHRFT